MVGGSRQAALSAVFACLVSASPAQFAWAEANAADLDAARALFAEALGDEGAGRLREALRKFQQVRAVRDTPAVEYRIGTCEEGIHESALAYIAYRQAMRLGGADADVADIVDAARMRLEILAKHVAQLELRFPAPLAADLDVRVDGEAVPISSLREPRVLEPGRHDVTARFGNRSAIHDDVVLPEGGQVALTLSEAPTPVPPPAVAPRRTSAHGTAAIATFVVAGVLEAAAIVVAVVREGEISKLDHDCPGGRCPSGSDRNDLEATRSRALVEGPLAIAMGAAGLVAGGVSVYLALVPSSASPSGARGSSVMAYTGVGGTFP